VARHHDDIGAHVADRVLDDVDGLAADDVADHVDAGRLKLCRHGLDSFSARVLSALGERADSGPRSFCATVSIAETTWTIASYLSAGSSRAGSRRFLSRPAPRGGGCRRTYGTVRSPGAKRYRPSWRGNGIGRRGRGAGRRDDGATPERVKQVEADAGVAGELEPQIDPDDRHHARQFGRSGIGTRGGRRTARRPRRPTTSAAIVTTGVELMSPIRRPRFIRATFCAGSDNCHLAAADRPPRARMGRVFRTGASSGRSMARTRFPIPTTRR